MTSFDANLIENIAVSEVFKNLSIADIQTIMQFLNITNNVVNLFDLTLDCQVSIDIVKACLTTNINENNLMTFALISNINPSDVNMFVELMKILSTLDKKSVELVFKVKNIQLRVSNRMLKEILDILMDSENVYDLYTFVKMYEIECYDEHISRLCKHEIFNDNNSEDESNTEDESNAEDNIPHLIKFINLQYLTSYSNIYADILENIQSEYSDYINDTNIHTLPVSYNEYTKYNKRSTTRTHNIINSKIDISDTHLLNVYHPSCKRMVNDNSDGIHAATAKTMFDIITTCFGRETLNCKILPKFLNDDLPFVTDPITLMIYEYYNNCMNIINSINGIHPQIIGTVAEYVNTLQIGNNKFNATCIFEYESILAEFEIPIRPFKRKYKRMLPTHDFIFIACSGNSYCCDGYIIDKDNNRITYIEVKNVQILDKRKDILKWFIDVLMNECKHGILKSYSQYLQPVILFGPKVFIISNATNNNNGIINFYGTMNINNPDVELSAIFEEYTSVKDDSEHHYIFATILNECCKVRHVSKSSANINNEKQTFGLYNVPKDAQFLKFIKSREDILCIAYKPVDKSLINNGFDPERKVHLIIWHEADVLPHIKHFRDILILRTDVKFIFSELLYILVSSRWPSMSEWISNVIYNYFHHLDIHRPTKPTKSDRIMERRINEAKRVVYDIRKRIKTTLKAYKTLS